MIGYLKVGKKEQNLNLFNLNIFGFCVPIQCEVDLQSF
jgi:hypothetical protein